MTTQFQHVAMEYHQPWNLSYMDCLSPILDPCSSLAQTQKNNNMNNSNSNSNSNSNNDSISNSNESNGGGDPDESAAMKRLSHNARERDRRKKLNSLYSSLRFLLPPSDHKKKLSIAGTVSRVLKYIPEQRQEVERLRRRKEQILNNISRRAHSSDQQQRQRPTTTTSSDSSARVVPTWISDTELGVQFTASDRTPVSDLLLRVEEIGLRVISFSSSVSSRARAFYTLHLEMERGCKVKFDELSEIFMALQEKQDRSHP